MGTITSVSALKNAIQLLETEQALKGEQLKAQFLRTFESLKPANILKCTIKEVATSPYFINNIIGTTLGLATGLLTKKLVVGASVGLVRKLLGSALQFGVTNVVAGHPQIIRSIGESVCNFFIRRKDIESEKRGSIILRKPQ